MGLSELTATIDYPMVIVTVAARGERAGCLVGFTTQCSVDPPRYAVCLSKSNRTGRVAAHADRLAVHFPGPEQRELAVLFGSATGDDVDKFARCRWEAGPGGTQRLSDCATWFVGEVVDRVDVGDHVAYVLDVVDASSAGDQPAFLTFQQVRDIDPGHAA